MRFSKLTFFLLALASLIVSGCAETELATHVAKSIPGQSKSQGNFKIGSPYKVDGKWYKPQEAYNFTETGIASWYGPQFHGKSTANGETFDMYELTAAHRTLQLPSLVRVTNLENGRSLIVRVNDRGPFKRGRVIDLSMRAAELLDFKNNGTAKVKLQVLTQESMAIAEAAKRGEDTRGIEVAMNEDRLRRPSAVASVQPASAQPGPQVAQIQPAAQQPQAPVPGHLKQGRFMPDPVVQQMPVTPTNIYVQAGSFSNHDNAIRLAANLQNYGSAQVYPAMVNGQQFYRVRLGPVAGVDKADNVLEKLAAGGHKQAIIVVD